MTLKRIRNLLFILISAMCLAIPFHDGRFGSLAFIAFAPYFFTLKNKTHGQAFLLSYLFGLVFYGLTGWWLTCVDGLGFVALVAYLAVYFALFGFLSVRFLQKLSDNLDADPKKIVLYALTIPALWVVLEYIRSWMISGLPWSLLAYSQWKNLAFIQIADITGAYGVSFFVLFINLAVYLMLKEVMYFISFCRNKTLLQTRIKVLIFKALFFLGIFFIVYGYGIARLTEWGHYAKNAQSPLKLRVAVLQGNIPQKEKFDARIKGFIFEKYKRLNFMAAIEQSDLIIWPETSFPGYLEDEPLLSAHLRSMVRQSRADVLVGAPTLGSFEEGLRFYNSAVLFGSDGEEIKRHHKIHLVPFGEFIPFEAFLGWLRKFYAIGHFEAGHLFNLFEIRSHHQPKALKAKFAVLICFEDIFPGLVRKFCSQGADFLVNITNDAWFEKTSAPYQHAQASIFRAVENRVNVIRAANTGLSCFISQDGRIQSSVKDNHGEEIFVTGYKTHEIQLRKVRSFYTRFGEVFLVLCGFLMVLSFKPKKQTEVY